MAKKKGWLGCSFPVIILVAIIVMVVGVLGILAGPLGQKFNVALPSWLGWMSLDLPRPELPADVVFHIFGLPVFNSMLATWVTVLVLVVIALLITRKPKLIPSRVQSVAESILGYIYNLCVNTAGEKDGRKFFPLVATIFLFILFNALLALIPGFSAIYANTADGHHIEVLRAANTDLNTPLALALITFCTVEFMGFKRLGLGYLKKFIAWGDFGRAVGNIFKGKVDIMAMLSGFIVGIVGLLELVGEFIRIVSLTFRLFGSMLAGEIILLVIAYVVPYFVPTVFYGLEAFFAVIQALVFGTLTIVYISLSVSSHDSAEHHKAA
ncbi:MAG: F0F1 ATP synthase subunit A [Dehalococcoidia bacterium]|nr:F0F1 ATP synthase subunit A [Dehalococcoidia bacterium]